MSTENEYKPQDGETTMTAAIIDFWFTYDVMHKAPHRQARNEDLIKAYKRVVYYRENQEKLVKLFMEYTR